MLHYLLSNLKFSSKDLTKNVLKTLFSSFGILFIIAFLIVYLSFRTSITNYLNTRILGSLDINEIIITPKEVKASRDLFDDTPSPKAQIKVSQVKKIRNLKEISKTYSFIQMDYKTKLRGSLAGKSASVYIPIYGADPAFFKKTNPNWRSFRYKKDNPIPIIVPKVVIDYFNTVAPMTNIFKYLTEDDLLNLPVEIEIRVAKDKDQLEFNKYFLPAYAHSFSVVQNISGIIVPINMITDFSKQHQRESGKYHKGYTYKMMIAKVKHNKDIPKVTKRLKSMGLVVKSQSDIASKTNKMISIIDNSFMILGGVLLALTIISIFNSYLTIVYNRSYSFSLKRILGVSKLHIIVSFVLEAAIIGALYGIIGFYAGKGMTNYISGHISEWVPLFKGLKLASVDAGILPKAVLLSMLISAISALIPAIFASNKNLFKAVSK